MGADTDTDYILYQLGSLSLSLLLSYLHHFEHIEEAIIPRRRQALLEPELVDEFRRNTQHLLRFTPTETLNKQSREAFRELRV